MPLYLKLLARDLTTGRLTFLLLAMVLAVATITGIALFTSRIENTIVDEASELLAADAQVRGSAPFPDQWPEQAQSLGMQTAEAIGFRAMAFHGERAQLASVKAVGHNYPLKGQLLTSSRAYGEPSQQALPPQPGEVLLNSRLFEILDVTPGQEIEIGDAVFRVAAALLKEPDNPQSYFNVAPRVMIHIDDVPATGAVQTGSRVNYTLMLAGNDRALTQMHEWLKTRLGEHYRWVDVSDSNRSMGEALVKAESFLFLAGSLSVLLSGVAIALASRRYAQSRIAQVALLKTLGLTPKAIRSLFLVQITLIGLVGIGLGSLVGWLIQWPILAILEGFFTRLATPDTSAYWLGASTGFIALAGFAIPPIIALYKVTPVAVLQHKSEPQKLEGTVPVLLGLSAILLLVALYSRDLALTAFIALGTAICLFLAGALAWAFAHLSARVGRVAPHGVRLGLANLERHRRFNVPQIVMFAILFMLVCTLILIRTSLIDTWQKQLPEDAPNHFIFNVFPEQRQGLEALFVAQGIERSPYYPMVRGRVVQVNDQTTDDMANIADSDVNYERELNLTWSTTLGEDNRVLDGSWWNESDADVPLLASVEDTYAEGLGIEPGDQITLSVSGERLEATVANIRSVQWDSMNPNFYVVLNRPILDGLSANWITSFYLPEDQKNWLNTLVRTFPTVSLIELDQTIAQLQDIVAKVTLAVEFIWLLVLAAGVLVLLTSIQATLDLRLREGALIRAMGASRKLLRLVLWIEFATIGLLSGILAVVGAEAVVYLLQSRLFELPYSPHWVLWGLTPFAAAACIGVIGLWSTRRVHRVSPLAVLRDQEARV